MGLGKSWYTGSVLSLAPSFSSLHLLNTVLDIGLVDALHDLYLKVMKKHGRKARKK